MTTPCTYFMKKQVELIGLIAAATIQFLNSAQIEAPSDRLTGLLEVATKMPALLGSLVQALPGIHSSADGSAALTIAAPSSDRQEILGTC